MLHRTILAFATLVPLSPPCCADVVLSLSLPAPKIHVGDILLMELGVSGLAGEIALAGFDVDVGFDPGMVNLREIHFGDPQSGDRLHFDPSGPPPQSANRLEAGLLNLLEVSMDPADRLTITQPDQFVLVTLTFEARVSGLAAFALSANGVTDVAGEILQATATGAQVAIVPIPESLNLASSALFSLALIPALAAHSRARMS